MNKFQDHLTPSTADVVTSDLTVNPDNIKSLEASLESNAHLLKVNPISVLIADWRSIYEHDPTAKNWLEVLFYPGLQALCLHRFTHWLYGFGIPFLPRFLSHLNRFLTGIEIHPGATIGKGVFIDHGMGIVIGETTIVGDYAVIYQGVTLGGTGKETGKRHPTLGSHVIVGAGALLLGNIEIGDRVRVGAGSVVLRSVPNDCTVVGVPGRVTRNHKEKVGKLLGAENFPDPEADVIRSLFERIKTLETQIADLQSQPSVNNILNTRKPIDEATTNSNEMIEEFLNGAGI